MIRDIFTRLAWYLVAIPMGLTDRPAPRHRAQDGDDRS